MSWAGRGGAREVLALVLNSLRCLTASALSCNSSAHSSSTCTSPIVGRSAPVGRTHLTAMFINFLKQSGATFPIRNGSIIAGKVSPLCTHSDISLETDLAHNTSSNTIPNEKTSDFSEDPSWTTRSQKAWAPSFGPKERWCISRLDG